MERGVAFRILYMGRASIFEHLLQACQSALVGCREELFASPLLYGVMLLLLEGLLAHGESSVKMKASVASMGLFCPELF